MTTRIRIKRDPWDPSKKYGMLAPVRPAGKKNGQPFWLFTCDCGREKVLKKSDVNIGKRKSCGCTAHNFLKDLTGQTFGWWRVIRRAPHEKGSRWECICKCGKVQRVHSGDLRSGQSGACKACFWKRHTPKSGPDNPAYNPSISDEERASRKDRRSSSDREWERVRTKVFERDSFTCRSCLQKGGTLNAHHVYPWRDHKDLRYCEENCITLCKVCHKKFHSTFGQIQKGFGGRSEVGKSKVGVSGMTGQNPILPESVVARTIFAEARGEPEEGQCAVASVIMNRAVKVLESKKSSDLTGALRDVCLYPKQFSCWVNFEFQGKEPVFQRGVVDPEYDVWLCLLRLACDMCLADFVPTTPATLYHASSVTPYWAAKSEYLCTIGNHLFYKEKV